MICIRSLKAWTGAKPGVAEFGIEKPIIVESGAVEFGVAKYKGKNGGNKDRKACFIWRYATCFAFWLTEFNRA